jgi:hypothetical protein
LISFGVDSSGEYLFVSDWSNSTGTDDTAVRDGEKWNPNPGANNQLTGVVSSTGLDFPTTNVLEVVVNESGAGKVIRKTGLTVPDESEDRYYRWYFRTVFPDDLNSTSGDTNTHPIQDGQSIGSTNWAFNVNFDYDAENWNADFQVLNQSYPLNHWWTPTLQKNITYRFELHLHRYNVSHYQIHPRVYWSNNTLLYDDDDFTHTDSSNTLADLNPYFPFENVNYLDGLNSGFNGLLDPTREAILYYQGAFCVKSDDWCGEYQVGEGE